MREPRYASDGERENYVPVSQLPREDLEYIARGGRMLHVPEEGEDSITSEIFIRQYAKRILSERGA